MPWCGLLSEVQALARPELTAQMDSDLLHASVAIRQHVQAHLVLILSRRGAEVEGFH